MKIKIISSILITVTIASMLFVGRYLVNKNQCLDGHGSDLYFDKKELVVDKGENLYPKNIIAQVDIKCDVSTYKINNFERKSPTILKKEDFDKFIADYNQKCGDCLLISKIGGLYQGEIFTVDHKPIK